MLIGNYINPIQEKAKMTTEIFKSVLVSLSNNSRLLNELIQNYNNQFEIYTNSLQTLINNKTSEIVTSQPTMQFNSNNNINIHNIFNTITPSVQETDIELFKAEVLEKKIKQEGFLKKKQIKISSKKVTDCPHSDKKHYAKVNNY